MSKVPLYAILIHRGTHNMHIAWLHGIMHVCRGGLQPRTSTAVGSYRRALVLGALGPPYTVEAMRVLYFQ